MYSLKEPLKALICCYQNILKRHDWQLLTPHHDWAGGCVNRNSTSAICLQLWWQPQAKKLSKTNKRWKSEEQLRFSVNSRCCRELQPHVFFITWWAARFDIVTQAMRRKRRGKCWVCNGKHCSVWFPSPCLSESVMRRRASSVLGWVLTFCCWETASEFLGKVNVFFLFCFVFAKGIFNIADKFHSDGMRAGRRKYYWSDMQMACLLTSSVALN